MTQTKTKCGFLGELSYETSEDYLFALASRFTNFRTLQECAAIPSSLFSSNYALVCRTINKLNDSDTLSYLQSVQNKVLEKFSEYKVVVNSDRKPCLYVSKIPTPEIAFKLSEWMSFAFCINCDIHSDGRIHDKIQSKISLILGMEKEVSLYQSSLINNPVNRYGKRERGSIDLFGNGKIVEIKSSEHWRLAVEQLGRYSKCFPSKQLSVYLFTWGFTPKSELQLIAGQSEHLGIEVVYEPLRYQYNIGWLATGKTHLRDTHSSLPMCAKSFLREHFIFKDDKCTWEVKR